MTAEQVGEIETPQQALQYIQNCDPTKYSIIIEGNCGVAISTVDEDGLYEVVATNGRGIYAHMVDYSFALSTNRLMAKSSTTAESLAESLIF